MKVELSKKQLEQLLNMLRQASFKGENAKEMVALMDALEIKEVKE